MFVFVCVDFCGLLILLLFCLYCAKWNLPASGTMPYWLFWLFHPLYIHTIYPYVMRERESLCIMADVAFIFVQWLYFPAHNRRLMFQIKIRPFSGRFDFLSLVANLHIYKFQIAHTAMTKALTKIHKFQNSKTKTGDNPENERNVTDCNDVSIKQTEAIHLFRCIDIVYVSLQNVCWYNLCGVYIC